MDDFKNIIDLNKFRRTNGPWNELMLNDPWSVGYVSTLIELKSFSSKEEWESFYYEMGEVRLNRLANLSPHDQAVLNNEELIRTNKSAVNSLSWDLKNLNTQNGRTKSELQKKGIILFEYIKVNNPDITLEDCQEAVRFRVICETWNGIVLREHNTIKTLERELPQIIFIKKEGTFDHKYAVDFDLIYNGMLVCGIQIKPRTYTFNTPYLRKARYANQIKNELYLQDYGKKVLNVISDHRGVINNSNVINAIRELVQG